MQKSLSFFHDMVHLKKMLQRGKVLSLQHFPGRHIPGSKMKDLRCHLVQACFPWIRRRAAPMARAAPII